MKIELLLRGQKFDIYGIRLNDGSYPVIVFLEQLKEKDIASHRSLVNVIQIHADYGPLLNETKSRPIEGRDNLFEFKTKQGARVLYFYLPGRKTVLTHGFKKGAPGKQEYAKAEKIRDQYLKEINNG